MNVPKLFTQISQELNTKLHFLGDKPEETLESTLKALWMMAAGIPISAEKALHSTLYDLSEQQIKYLHQLIELRLNNVPLAHITKRQSFMGIELLSDKRALIPRKETEILGRKALELSKQIARSKETVRILDVCCGSGNLGIAVAHFNPQCHVYASDISMEAVELTQDNIDLLQLNQRIQVKQGDLMSAFESDEYYEKIDIVICNPPYILSSNVPKMNSEISGNEPVLAFDGGMLGIKIIQRLIREAPKYLNHQGWLIFEVGVGQGDFIAQLCERSAFYQKIEAFSDNYGNTRVILAQNIL